MNSQLEIKLAPTPESDAMEYYDAMCDPDRVVEADFARKLERERDVAQKAMGDARDILLDAMPDANAPTKILAEMIVAERDRYQESADVLVDRLGATQERMINAERERDEAQERADTMFVKHAEILDQARRERDEWKAKYIQQNKDLGCEQMDPNGTIWDYAKKVQRELTVVTKQRDNFEDRLRVELGGHPDSELWGDAGLIAATMRCVDALDAVTEQRDRLAEALIKCREDSVCEQVRMEKCRYTKAADESQANIDRADKALQYLKQPTKP